METVGIICSIDMMPLRLVSSFKLSFWQIKIRLFPDNSGCAKPPCSACRNGGTNEGRKYLCYLDLITSVPFARILSEYFAALCFLQILGRLYKHKSSIITKRQRGPADRCLRGVWIWH